MVRNLSDRGGPWTSYTLTGGDPALDFVNTNGGSDKARNLERLTAPAEAFAWGRAAGLLDQEEADRLAAHTRREPSAADAALDRLRTFREDLHRQLAVRGRGSDDGRATGISPRTPVGEPVAEALRTALHRAVPILRHGRLVWLAEADRSRDDLLLDRVVLAAERLLVGPDLDRLRQCERCSFLFLDKSRGRGRRWCSMATCGNRTKARRHYARTQTARPPAAGAD